jgi:type II secretory pathway component HofQ
MVMVEVCIAEQLPPSRDGQADDGESDDSAMEKAPHMEEDGAAWLAWAKNHGRLDVLSRPQIRTLDNQPAYIMIGESVPIVAPRPGADQSATGNQIEQTEVGLSVGLTPRIAPEGLVVMELDVERTRIIAGHRVAGPIIGKTSAQTTVSAKDGETIVLGGLIHRTEDGEGSLIIALTPRVTPKR